MEDENILLQRCELARWLYMNVLVDLVVRLISRKRSIHRYLFGCSLRQAVPGQCWTIYIRD